MAEKETVILDVQVDTAKAQAELDEVRKKIDNLDQSSDTYKQDLKALQKEEQQLTKILNSQKGSYDQLSAQYSKNKKQLNAMSAEQRYATEEGKRLEAETRALYAQMNEMQKATGKYTLQVGNYRIALNDFKGTVKDAAQGMLGFVKACLKFIATPIGAVVTAIVAAFTAMKKALESTSAGQEKLARITGTLKGALNGLIEVVVQAGEVLVDLFSGNWRKLGDDIKEVKDAFLNIGKVADTTGKLAEAERKLERARMEWSLERSELEKERSQLEVTLRNSREGSADRLKAAARITEIENKILDRERANLQQQIDLLARKQKLTSNTLEDEQEMIALKIRMNELDIERNNRQAQLNKQINSATKETKDNTKKAEDAEKERAKAIQNNISLYKSQLALVQQGSQEAYKLEKDIAQATYDLAVANGTAIETAKNELLKSLQDIDAKYQKIVEDNEKKIASVRKEINDYTIDEEQRKYNAIYNEAKTHYDNIQQLLDDNLITEQEASDMRVKVRTQELSKIAQLEDEKEKKQREGQKKANETYINSSEQLLGSLADMQNTNTRKGFESAKAMQLSEATVGMISGAVQAYSSTMAQAAGGLAAKTAQAAAAAASVVAQGMANIAKIKATQFGGTSSAVTSATTARTTTSVNETIMQKTADGIKTTAQPATQSVLVVDEVTAKQMAMNNAKKIAVQ